MRLVIKLGVTCIALVTAFISCKKEDKTEAAPTYGTMTDVQGNSYKTVKIGNQWWMAENLKVTVFNDNSPLTNISETSADSIWSKSKTASYCIYDTTLGALYNWKVIDNLKQIAPKGWHVASDEEWKDLEKSLGMTDAETIKSAWRGTNEADKLLAKSSSIPEISSYAFGTNESGFNGLFAGCRLFNGEMNKEKNTAFWWTSTPSNDNEAWYRYIDLKQKKIFRQHTYNSYGFSIRCVKD